MHDRLKNTANEVVMALLFASLLVIFLIVPPSNLVTFLCVITLAISLIVAITSDWQDLGILALFAGLVSLAAAYFVGRSLRFGSVGAILLPLLWLGVLFLVYGWVVRRIIRVPDDRAFVVRNLYSRRITVAPKPIVLPLVERVIATIPLYKLSQQVSVEKINTRSGFNIDLIRVRIGYQVIDPLELLINIRNKEGEQSRLAKERNQDLRVARNDPTFWETVLARELSHEVDDIVRKNIFENKSSVIATYDEQRETLATDVEERLTDRMRPWGIRINTLEFEHIDVAPERWQAFYRDRTREREAIDAEHYSKLEAQRVKRVLESQLESEAQRVTAIIEALRDAGVDITADVVIRAIRATSDWMMENDYTLLPSTPPASLPSQPAAPKPAGDKKDNGAKKS